MCKIGAIVIHPATPPSYPELYSSSGPYCLHPECRLLVLAQGGGRPNKCGNGHKYARLNADKPWEERYLSRRRNRMATAIQHLEPYKSAWSKRTADVR